MKRAFRFSSTTRWVLTVGLILIVLMTLMRIGLYMFFNKQNNSFSDVVDAFLLGFRFDLRSVSLVLLCMLILANLPGLRPFRSRRAKRFWLCLLALMFFVVLFSYVIDFAHYAYLKQRLNAGVLNYLEDAAISMNMVWESYPVVWLIFALLLITFLLWMLIRLSYTRIKSSTRKISRKQRIIEISVLVIVFAALIFGRVNQYPLRWSDAFALGSDYKANLSLNPFESFFNTLKFRGNEYDKDKLEKLFPVLAEYLGIRDTTSAINFERRIAPVDSTRQPLNVVLVLCESFSAYKSSGFGNPLNTTPFFDSISRNGILFDRCFTPAYGTARGVWATITGIPDVEAPTTASRNPAAVDQQTIINNFDGYQKFYFLGGSTSWANIRGLLTNNIEGLKIYEQEHFKSPQIDVWGISDKNLFLESNKILARQQQPFFAIIQTADNHRPYTIPSEDLDEFRRLQPPADSLRKYSFESADEYNAFRYTDFGFKKFIEAAQKESYYENTLFVFIGDHGIPGNAGDLFPKAWTEQRLTQHHVPLLFYAPGHIKPQRIHSIASQTDVLPTIAGICKIPYVNTTLGRDLLDTASNKPFSFLFDIDNRLIGVADNKFMFRKRINTADEGFYPMELNSSDTISTEHQQRLRDLTEALYEASKYLLLNNKK
jgi:phosphoglycerol transferase MdoB-like AlkP superfamily enzyme